MSGARIVLKRDVSRDQVGYVAYDKKWHIHSATRESESPQRQVWVTKDGGTVITFLEDPYLELRYLVVQGAQAAEAAQILRSALPCWTIEESFEFLRTARTSDEKIHAVYLTAASAPSNEDPQIVTAIQELARDRHADVRQALLVAMGYLASWSIVRSVARFLKENDPDHDVRRSAEHLLEGLGLPKAT